MWFLKNLIFGPASVEKIAEKVVKKISQSAFWVFRDEDIRKMLNFSQQKRSEQDRIFNELVVTGLSLAILILETVSNLAENSKSIFYKNLKKELSIQHLDWLKGLGIKQQYVDLWGELIEMRCEEYRKDFQKYQSYFPDIKKSNPWINIIAIGGLHHLRRGKTSPDDPLFKHLLSWLESLAITIEKILIRLCS